MPPGDEPVSSLGESGLLERVFAKLPSAPSGEIWSGDDAAVITVGDSSCLLTTDAIVEGVDFELTSASGYDIGWKAIAVNASDIAAMGGRPTRAVATLYLRPDHAVELVDDVLSGLLAGADRYGLAIVGGDVTEAAELAVSIALLGDIGENGPVLRSGAMPGAIEELAGTDTKVARIGSITAEGVGATIGDRSLADWTKESWDHLRPR
jgi:thiamine-monophosphate kinase